MMTIKAEFIPGTDIRDAFVEAIAFATKNKVYIEFDFNGVTCCAAPYGDPDMGVESYHANNSKFAMANSVERINDGRNN